MPRSTVEDRLARHRGRIEAYEHAIAVMASHLDVDVSQEIRDGMSREFRPSKELARETYRKCLGRIADGIEQNRG